METVSRIGRGVQPACPRASFTAQGVLTRASSSAAVATNATATQATDACRAAARRRAVLCGRCTRLCECGGDRRLFSAPSMDRSAIGAAFRGPALPAVIAGRRRLRIPAGDRAQSAPPFQGAGASGRRGGPGQDDRSLPGSQGVLDSRPGAQGAGAHASVAGLAVERRADRKVWAGAGLARYRRVPPRPGAVLEDVAAGGRLHCHGPDGCARRGDFGRAMGHGDRG